MDILAILCLKLQQQRSGIYRTHPIYYDRSSNDACCMKQQTQLCHILLAAQQLILLSQVKHEIEQAVLH